MRYYKQINDSCIIAIGTGGGGTEITEQEYNAIMAIIQQKPQRTETTDYRLKTDFTWEQYERIEPSTEPEPPDNLEESSAFLLENDLLGFPALYQPDYFNENEPEPDFFE